MTDKERPTKTEDGFTILYSPDDIPEFATEREEAEFWDTHTWSDELMDEAAKLPRDPDLPTRKEGEPNPMGLVLTVRLDADTSNRYRHLCRKTGLNYIKLLRQILLERLDEEEKHESALSKTTENSQATETLDLRQLKDLYETLLNVSATLDDWDYLVNPLEAARVEIADAMKRPVFDGIRGEVEFLE